MLLHWCNLRHAQTRLYYDEGAWLPLSRATNHCGNFKATIRPLLYCTVLCCAVLYCAAMYCTVLYCTELYFTVLFCVVLCCTVLYVFVLVLVRILPGRSLVNGVMWVHDKENEVIQCHHITKLFPDIFRSCISDKEPSEFVSVESRLWIPFASFSGEFQWHTLFFLSSAMRWVRLFTISRAKRHTRVYPKVSELSR
jgi:hypothetical protein